MVSAISNPWPPQDRTTASLEAPEHKLKVSEVAWRVFQSPFLLGVATIGGTLATLGLFKRDLLQGISFKNIISTRFYPIMGAYMLVTFLYNRKSIIYDFSLTLTLMRNSNRWWNPIKINENDEREFAVLGGMPLSNWGHGQELNRRVGAVLSVVENFELYTQGLLSYPMNVGHWAHWNKSYKHIEASDFAPVPLDKIEEGVQYIHEQNLENRIVYVHCKAGKGRSATIVICYLLRHGGFGSPQEAIAHVKKQRNIISINARQRGAIEQYFDRYCKNGNQAAEATQGTEATEGTEAT